MNMENVQPHKNDQLQLEFYKVAVATRNFEIELFWKRATFFWAFITSAFIGFAALKKDNPGYALVIADFGLVCSFAWTLANRGSKYWYEAWEQKLSELEQRLGSQMFFKMEDKIGTKVPWLSGHRFSVSKLAIGLSDFTCFIWGVIVIRETISDFEVIKNFCNVVCNPRIDITVLSFAYMVYMFLCFKPTKS